MMKTLPDGQQNIPIVQQHYTVESIALAIMLHPYVNITLPNKGKL